MERDAGTTDKTIYALINYEDQYVHPLILASLAKTLPPSTYKLIPSISDLPTPSSRLLQFLQYESISFDHLLDHPSTSVANAYVIRKALIRKHYLSTTVSHWIVKYPDSILKRHVKPSVEFEVDYAEFLDDALVETWELRESWSRNAEVDEREGSKEEREWWILKPGMSERGQGIRLFSDQEELTAVFEEWDSKSDDEDGEREAGGDVRSDAGAISTDIEEKAESNGIITSQLRHFIAQPYIHPPLLLSPPGPAPGSTALRKFHIRTYVLSFGALQVYVYRPMLALFAARPYVPPWDQILADNRDEAMKAHLTNTCLQDSGDREGSVGLFWALPHKIPTQPYTAISPAHDNDWKSTVFSEICAITSVTFEAAARGMSIHFQPLPNAFEIFGLDFMIGIEEDGSMRTWLLEVNAFPDFRQTGKECKSVVEELFEGVVKKAVGVFFGVEGIDGGSEVGKGEDMVRVLGIDLGRR